MNCEFSLVSYRDVELLVYQPWWSVGLIHGMTTTQLAGSRMSVIEAAGDLCKALQVDQLAMPLQCHGADVLDLRDVQLCKTTLAQHGDVLRRESSDAIVAPLTQLFRAETFGYAIVTADCVPIVVRGDDGYSLIHAGWRGLANGVIRNGLLSIQQPREALIFACAGGQRYEVGQEVVDAIGPLGVCVPSPQREGAFLLDTAATAVKQLRAECPDIQVFVADVCTISDARFHSFRRDGKAAGRGVTFVVPPRA